MKKVLCFAALVAATLSVTSCKKDWLCTCSNTNTGVGAGTYQVKNASQKEAQDACSNYDNYWKIYGTSCSLN
jgi:heme-binding NEAT domain protein